LILAGVGLAQYSRIHAWRKPIAVAIAFVWPAAVYFAVHCLHDRVQGNWPSFIYPALALLAASVEPHQTRLRPVIVWCGRLAVPAAVLVLITSYLQTWTGVLPMGKSDPIARMTAVGLQPVTNEISSLSRARHAEALVTTRYVVSGWLAFYLRPQLPIIQAAESDRWSDAPVPTLELVQRPLLYITQHPDRELREIKPYFEDIRLLTCIPRVRNGIVIDTFCVYSLSGVHGQRFTRHGHIVFGYD
jgi:hypothetical protein